ncbi:MAG: DnaA N-terminal domain-containing protein, partial [Myxococcota bacterium]
MTRLPLSPAARPGATALGGVDAMGGETAEELDAGEELFAAMLEGLSQRVSLFVFRGFFEPLFPLRLDDRLLTLAAPSAFHRDWLRDHYIDLLEQAASECLGGRARVAIVHDERITGPSRPPPRLGHTLPPAAGPPTAGP